jgi:polyketide synthase PksJ
VKNKIEKTNVQEIFELSMVQKGMLFHYLKEVNENLYNVQLVFRIEGNPDINILEQAIHAVQSNNEVLRSVFSWDKVSKPLQVILKECPIDFSYYTVVKNTGEDIEGFVENYLTTDQQKRFSLVNLPIRITLIRTSEREFILCISHHHILYDGWSTGIFLEELFSCYNQLRKQESPRFGSKPTYKEVFHAIRKQLSGQQANNYWNKYLEGYDVKLFFNGNNNLPGGNGQIKKVVFTHSAIELENYTKEQKVTKASVIYAAFGILLQKYLDTPDIVFGTTVSDRDAALPGMEEVMGNFINTIPLRLSVENGQSLSDIVKTVSNDLAVRSEYNHTSYYDIRNLLKLKPGEQLFDTLVVIENYPLDEALINCNDDFTVKLSSVYENTSFPLVVSVFFEQELRIEFAWKAGYMDDDFAGALAKHFGKILRHVTENGNSPVQPVSLFSEEEVYEITTEFNKTDASYPNDTTIIDLFEKQVQKSPEAIAIKYGNRQISFYELNQQAERIAAWLQEVKGVIRGDLVGLLLERDEYLVPVILGVLKAGAAYIPIDPGYPLHRINAIIAAAELKVLISGKKIPGISMPLTGEVSEPVTDLDSIFNYTGIVKDISVSSKDLVYIIYTSGSTGVPKGVMITHQSLVNYITWAANKYIDYEKAVFPLYTSISFDLTVTSIFTPLITGGTIVIYNDHAKGFVIEKVLANSEVNIIKLTPSHLRIIRDSNNITCLPDAGIRTFIVGGEELSTQLAKDIYNKFQGRVNIYNEYGPTEATVGCMIYKFDPAEEYATVPIGIPVNNTQLYILNRHKQPVPKGSAGELYISGDGIAKGYIANQELTREKFLPNLFVEGRQMYKTGDLARMLYNGNLEFLGRIDDQVKLRGFRIELMEIENLLRTYPGIQEAVVAVKEKGEEKVLAAWFVSENEITAAGIKSFLLQQLPSYMVPAWFVRIKNLPLTSNGKLDKKALPNPVAEPVTGSVVPKGETEEKLLKIWADVLGHDDISVHSNFFDIGGDSLKLLTVSSRIKTILGKDVQVTDLTYYPTIADLAKFINPERSTQEQVAEVKTPAIRSNTTVSDIAVIGMAGRFPGAHDIDTFWENLASGKELIIRKQNTTSDTSIIKAKGFLEGYDLFDAEFFQYIPADAAMMDPQIRIFHECVWEALENAGYAPANYKGAIGLYGGATANPYYNLNVGIVNGDDLLEEWAALTFSDKDFLCPRVSYKLNLKGPSVNVFTACSTSLVAIETACNELFANKCSIAVAGGVSVTLHDNEGYVYRPGMVMSPDGYCRAFDEKAAGTVGGNGAGAVVLKKLDEALRDGDYIYAVIKGTATNNDGNQKVGFAAPAMEGQASAIELAIKNAGIEPESISYIETHGSGTLIGDPIEITALKKAFNSDKKQYCAIGSVKTNIGHLDAAAGVAGLIKTVLSLKNKQIPPSLHYNKPNPNIDFENSPFYVNTNLAYWDNGNYPRRAGVSSFGIGGTNVHIILEEAPPPAISSDSREYQLLLFSGKTPDALGNNMTKYVQYLQAGHDAALGDMAYTMQVGREHFSCRKIVVCKNDTEAIEQVIAAASGKTPSPYTGEHTPLVVFMFSGQGSEYINMCYDLYKKETIFKNEADKCIEIIKRISGKDLKTVIFPDTINETLHTIHATEYTQPALFVIEYALARLLMKWGIKPDYMIGHSFGEYVAACLSGVFSLEDALFLVLKRGELMQHASHGITLGMAITEEKLLRVLPGYGGISLATVNGPELCVVAGDAEAVYALQSAMEKEGHASSVISTSHAFHSDKMDDILGEFESYVKQVTIHPQQLSFISNISGKPAVDAELSTSGYWARHLRQTVRFADGIESLMENKEVIFIETGPGIELCTFVRSNRNRQKGHRVINLVRHPDKEGDDQYHLLTALGKLWQAGIEPGWSGFYENEKRRRVPLPTYSFASTRFPVKKIVPATNDAGPGDGLVRLTDISKWFYTPTWKMTPWAPANKHAGKLPVLLLEDEGYVTDSLADIFKQEHVQIIHVKKGTDFFEESPVLYTINPSVENNYYSLFERLLKHNRIPGSIIHAWAIDNNHGNTATDERFGSLYDIYFYSLSYIVKAAQQYGGILGKHITFITNDLHSITGAEQTALLKSLPVGLLKVIAQEYPTVSVNHIDISLAGTTGESFINKLYGEIKQETTGNTIAIRNGKRWLQSFDTIKTSKNSSARPVNFRKGGTYFITGGLGSVGYHLSRYLLHNYNATVILAGRTELPAREYWNDHTQPEYAGEEIAGKINRLQLLEKEGGQVLYVCCDVSDRHQLAGTINNIEDQFGPLHGIVHGAGIVRGQSINPVSILNREDYEYQFASKVTGLQALRDVAGDKELDFCIITSSLSPILGGLEFAAYASANAYIEYFINYHRERSQLPNWVCANIDGFNLDGGKGEGINEREIDEVFERVLSVVHLPQVIVSVGDLNKRVDRWVKRMPDNEDSEQTQDEAGGAGKNNMDQATTQHRLIKIWKSFFGIAEADAEDDFFESGGDSLKALTMIGRIHKEFNIELPIKQLFNNSSIAKLSACIDALSSGGEAVASQGYIPIPVAAQKDAYPLSSVQRRLYFLFEFDKQSIAYNQVLTIRLKGNVSITRLKNAFHKLILRHESLRTCFEIIDDEPRQLILQDFDFQPELFTANGNEDEIIRQFIRPFDLNNDLLIRVGLIDMAPGDYILIVDMHHIITDAVSKSVLVKDFMSLYNNEELPVLPLQYKDFVEWQQSEKRQQEILKNKQFWIDEFSTELPVVELPEDFMRPSVKSYEGNTIGFRLSPEETTALAEIAEKEGSTMFMLLLSAYTIFLARLSNQEDVVVGTITAGRQHPDLENIIGMFVNTIPIRVYPAGDCSFTTLLEEVKTKALLCFENQAYPYEALIDELKVERDSSRNPLFDALFSYRNYEQTVLEIPGLLIEPYRHTGTTSDFDITLTAVREDEQLVLEIEYCTRLFKPETIVRFIGYFKKIVSAIISDKEIKIAEIEILSAEEQEQMLYGFNNTPGYYEREETMVQLFEKQVEKTPAAIAIAYEGRQLTYKELNERSNQLAHFLREEHRVQPDQAVGILMERSETMMIGLLSILKAGAAYVPIDPLYPKKRIEYILENCGATILLTDRELEEGVSFSGKVLPVGNYEMYSTCNDNPVTINTRNDLCYIIYTSGSTGNPKGVMISHGSVINFFMGLNQQLVTSEEDCMLAVTSTSFDISVLELFWTICQGVQVVIHPSDISLTGLDRYIAGNDRAVDFSLFFFSSYNNKDEDKYNLLLESVKYADQEGFTAVWTPERHFHEFGGLYPNPSVTSAALAMITTQLQLRGGSVVAPLHDAVRIAEEWAVVDNLSNGRIGLSFASGWNPNDFALCKENYQDRNKTMFAKIKETKKLWKGESIKRMNGLGKEVELRVFPEPVQKELPVWVTSGGNEETFVNAGAAGANLLTHLLGQDVEDLARKIKFYRESRKRNGHDESTGKVTVMLHTYIGDDIQEVEKVVEQPFIEYLKSSIGLNKILSEETGLKEDDIPEKDKERILNNAFKRYYKTGSLIGTKSTCSSMVVKLKEIGVDEIACLVDFGIEETKVLAGLKNLKALKDFFKQGARIHKPVTMLQSTPSFIKLIREGEGSQHFLRSLQLLLIGGEAVPASLVRKLRTDTDAAIYNMYGPTETTIWSCMHAFAGSFEKVSVGKPMLNTRVYILNKAMEAVLPGVAGDLYIGGDGLARGYWNRPELTAEKFIPHPFREGERIYKTGDVARWLTDGTIEIIGREDHQVKIRGYRIEPGEIESCLLGFETVKEAVVVAKEGEEGGDKYLIAYLIAGDTLDFAMLREYLSNRLPQYMIPAHFVKLSEFPLTPNGKIDRKLLPDPVMGAGNEYIGPSTETEEKLVEIWSEILKIDKEVISIRGNFFELGGHSLNAIVLVRKILKEFNVELSLQKIFVINTVEDIADLIDNERWVKKGMHNNLPVGKEIILD